MNTYPMHVDAHLDSGLSRWLWLVKWLLVIPHYVVLAFLWLAFMVLSVIAFFAILFTGRYPRGIFDFNVGVLRWSWRVAYYAYGALGTDRYPPFTLAEVPDYPAHLSVDYPEHLSRGLVLVKWWLLALPHYLIVAIFAGGGWYWTSEVAGEGDVRWSSAGLIGLLVFIAGVILLFTGRYPRALFDFVLGMNRWVLRVAAYAGLMTDEYPPFRFDPGEDEPGSGVAARVAVPPSGAPPGVLPPPPAGTTTYGAPPPASPPPSQTTPWTTGRVLALAFGTLVFLVSMGFGIAGATLAFADSQLRDSDGFLMSGDQPVATQTYAIVSQDMELHSDVSWLPEALLGDAKVTATSSTGDPVFIGVGSSADVANYLGDVEHVVVTDLRMNGDLGDPSYRNVPGGGAPGAPADQDFWVAQASGTGTQAIDWTLESGTYTVVVMDPTGASGVFADVAAGVTVPGMSWVVGVLLSIAATGLIVAIALLLIAFRTPKPSPPAPPAATVPPAGGVS
ncbi:MAG: DUF4389 domain-containing protein [Nocardioides sp.]